MRTDPGFIANLDTGTDNAEGADLDVLCYFGIRIDDGQGMDHSGFLVGAHQIGAAAQFVAYVGAALEHPDSLYPPLDAGCEPELVARLHRTLETRIVNAEKVKNGILLGQGEIG